MSVRIISRQIRNLKRFDPDRIIVSILDARREDIARYVSEIQLFMEGQRGQDGKAIDSYDSYSPVTIAIKRQKGQPTDRVTLRDTGDFHRSITAKVTGGTMEIVADDWKADKLMDRYGDGILNLSDEHLESIKRAILLPALKMEFRKALSHG